MNHMNKTSKIISGIVILVVVSGLAFYAGTMYAKGQSTSSSAAMKASFAGRAGRTGGTGGASGSGFVSGNIISKDASSITLQLPNNNGSKIVFYSTATQIGKFTSGTADDLTNGTTVMITGTTNSDGSVTAQSIQIRPAGQNGQGPQNPSQSGQ